MENNDNPHVFVDGSDIETPILIVKLEGIAEELQEISNNLRELRDIAERMIGAIMRSK